MKTELKETIKSYAGLFNKSSLENHVTLQASIEQEHSDARSDETPIVTNDVNLKMA